MIRRAILFLRNLPWGLKVLYRTKCRESGHSMEQVTCALIRLYLCEPKLVEPYLKQLRLEADHAVAPGQPD